MIAIPVCPRASAIGPATMANAISAVMVAMTGSQIICRSCLKSCKDARRIALPVGLLAAICPPLSLCQHTFEYLSSRNGTGVCTVVRRVRLLVT